MGGRRPDMLLKGMNRKTGVRTDRIGAAWNNADGTTTVVLDPGVVIESNADLVLTLFPNDRPAPRPGPEVAGIQRYPIDTRKMVK